MIKHYSLFIMLSITVLLLPANLEGAENSSLFTTMEEKEAFCLEISSLVSDAWKTWQDSVMINDINVDGSRGLLSSGDIDEPVITSASIVVSFNRKGKSQDYIYCVKVVADAVENGMRLWQRGYVHNNIPFPQGASCAYTLPPCNNVPVILASGQSTGDRAMTEEALFNYMLYRSPANEKDVIIVFRGAAQAISECFDRWKSTCSIVGILASGGIAPQPAPMGRGPGPVIGAKGYGGKLIGAYFDGDLMNDKMMEYFIEEKALKE